MRDQALRLAGSLATAGGALGAMLETDDAVREAAYALPTGRRGRRHQRRWVSGGGQPVVVSVPAAARACFAVSV
jgi:hypothetical protein